VKEPEVVSMFPHIELDHFRNMIHWLTFRRAPHGTGTNLTWHDCMAMGLDELLAHWSFLREAWDAEDSASKRGAR